MDDVTIRPEQPADHPVVRSVVTAAFGDEGAVVADLVDALVASGHALVSLVAEVGGEVVGHVQLNRSWVDARERLVEVLVLAPLAVAPQRQGRGLGSALVAEALVRTRGRGCPAIFLEGSPDYYGARGFERADARGFSPPSNRIPAAAFQVVTTAAHEEWMTGALVYCGPFWELDCVGLRDPLLRELEERFGRAAGPGSGARSR